MTAPKTITWELEPHTRAKHAILRRYLQAWLPILAPGNFPRIAYIDGFAGPGRYSSGEDGSPAIALKEAIRFKDRIRGQVTFAFVERDDDRAAMLQSIVQSMDCPGNFLAKVYVATFVEAYQEIRKNNSDWRGRLVPTFAFIDPFGWSGVPFAIVQDILSQPSCEVFVTFMFEEMNRFIGHPDQAQNFDSFFGTPRWREGIGIIGAPERNRFFHDLYAHQLKTDGAAKYVRSFRMSNETGATDYYLFYATNSRLGLQRMKEAMWKIDASGEFAFSDATDPNQLVMLSDEPNYRELERLILAKFAGQTVTRATIEEFVLADTAYRETHYKQQILKALEESAPPKIEVINAPSNRRRGTYSSPDLQIRFL